MRPKIRTRQQWWDYCTGRGGTSGDQVSDILTDWRITDAQIRDALIEIRDLARTGLPIAGMTEEQCAKHRLNRVSEDLTRMIDGLEQ